MSVIFGNGVPAPSPRLSISAVPAFTPTDVRQPIRLDLCQWYTAGFE